MRIRYRVAIAVALVVLIGTGAWLVLSPREPSYDGKPLSYWLSQYGRWAGIGKPLSSPLTLDDRLRVSSALYHIGSNALPTLSKILRAQDSSLKLKFMQLAGRQHIFKIHFVTASQLDQVAFLALQDMGSQAVCAVPVLAEVYAREIAVVSNHPGRTNSTELLLFSIPKLLSSLGPLASNAVPALALAMSCTNVAY